ncbi:hypothetical protein ACFVZD_43675 [Streptomyces sp. NPDC058287]|uniref:hypothetical protein n=1 Tax=unclassified Streptomyces TaxID=2593676 RepID=UPI0036EF6B29
MVHVRIRLVDGVDPDASGLLDRLCRSAMAGDPDEAERVAMRLVDDTGFDPYDAGTLADS